MHQVSEHLKASSQFNNVNLAPPDPILKMNAIYKADPDPVKISVGVGAYRTEEGKPYILNCVKKAERMMLDDPNNDHEYLPMAGLQSFTDAAVKLILGADSHIIKENRAIGFQAISGTGALRVGAELLNRFRKSIAYVSKPTWGNHLAIFGDCGFEVREYQYWDPATRGLNESFFDTLRSAPNGSIFVLHGCAHNPTGVDPTEEQWKLVAKIMKEKNHFPFFDCAYQGFASGDLDKDAWSVRYFVDQGFEMFIAQSFAKNLGLYGERVGNLTLVVHNPDVLPKMHSNLCKIVRAMYSCPPAHGAKIASLVLNTPELYKEWTVELKAMADRIKEMRVMLFDLLTEMKTPGTWNHITDQIGMFTFTGLTQNQCKTLVGEHHIYLIDNGRISIAGLNTKNIRRFAEKIDWVVRNIQ